MKSIGGYMKNINEFNNFDKEDRNLTVVDGNKVAIALNAPNRHWPKAYYASRQQIATKEDFEEFYEYNLEYYMLYKQVAIEYIREMEDQCRNNKIKSFPYYYGKATVRFSTYKLMFYGLYTFIGVSIIAYALFHVRGF
jgi:hypothetical protein